MFQSHILYTVIEEIGKRERGDRRFLYRLNCYILYSMYSLNFNTFILRIDHCLKGI